MYIYIRMASTNSFLLKINSRDANNKGITNPITVSLNNLGNKNIVSIDVKSCSIPNVFYNITQFNNTLLIYFSVTSYVSVLLPVGQYTMTTLLSALNQIMVTAGLNFTFYFDSLKNKIYTYAMVNYSFIRASSTMFGVIGGPETTDFIGNPISNTYLPNFPDLSGARNIYIKTNFSSMNLLEKEGGNKNIICVVPCTVGFSNIIHYINQEDDIEVRRSYIYSQHLSNIELQLVDVLGNNLDLGGNHWEIIFKCIENI